jgi:addiction module HigA family antidote
VSQVEAAQRMKIPFQRLNALVKGRRGVSADAALLFEALTGWDAQIWLVPQAKWDLWHALRPRGQRPKARALRRSACQAGRPTALRSEPRRTSRLLLTSLPATASTRR